MMGSIFHAAFNTLLVIIINFASGEIHHITSSQNSSSCPLQHCIDLSKLATIDFSSGNSSNLNITLLFLPGYHILNRELVLTSAVYVHVATTASSETVRIECVSNIGTSRMVFSNVIEVLIEGLIFIGCGGNLISMVDNFAIMESIFKGVADGSTALIFTETVALINACVFVNNMGSIGWKSRHEVGGAIIVSNSSVWINGTLFERNSAVLGGAIFIEEESNVSIENSLFRFHNTSTDKNILYSDQSCSLSVDSSSFIRNFVDSAIIQSLGGPLLVSSSEFKHCYMRSGRAVLTAINNGSLNITYTSFEYNLARALNIFGGTVFIDHSVFICNTNDNRGGAIYAREASFYIADCFFVYNSARLRVGGVIHTFRGNFTIINSVFINNSAIDGGVIHSESYGYFCVVNSTFLGNTATNGCGGVVNTHHDGTFLYIYNSSFTGNEARGTKKYTDGGVIQASLGGLFRISNCNFTHNSADTGGVMLIF